MSEGGKLMREYKAIERDKGGRKAVAHINSQIYEGYARYCESFGSTPQIKVMRHNSQLLQEIDSDSDDYSVTHNSRSEKCAMAILKKFSKFETVNFIKMRQYAKTNSLSDDLNERTGERIKKAERDFALDLNLLANESAKDSKIMGTISAIENERPELIFNPYRNHQSHLITRFGLLFYNDRIVIPENIRGMMVSMLHQGHAATTKMELAAESVWWPGIYKDIRTKVEKCTACRLSGKSLITQLPTTEKFKLDLLSEPNQEIQLDFADPIKSKSRGEIYLLVAVDRFSKWPTATICSRTDNSNRFKIFEWVYYR